MAVPPLRMLWLPAVTDASYPVQILLAAPRSLFPAAPARNRARRRLREAWRLHKQEWYDFCREQKLQLAAALVYTRPEEFPFPELEEKIILTLKRFKEAYGAG